MLDPNAHANRHLASAALIIGVAAAIAGCVALATRSLAVGSIAGGWVYPYVPEPSRWWPVTAAAGGTLAALAALVVRADSRTGTTWAAMLAWLLVGAAVLAVVRAAAPVRLESLFISDGSNSFYSVARAHPPDELLGAFNKIRHESPIHAQSNMPGKVLLVWLLRNLTVRTDVLPLLLAAVSALGAVLMWVLVRDLFGDARIAVYSAAFYLLTPGRIFFLPLMNTVTPVVILAFACVLARWLKTGRSVFAVLAGVALYALVFFEPLPLVMGLFFLALVFGGIVRGTVTPQRFVAQVVGCMAAFMVTAELVMAVTGFNVVRTFRLIHRHAVEFNVDANRPYWPAVRSNLVEFVVATGFCQAALFFGALAAALHGPGGWRARLARPIATVCLGLFAVLIATDLAGVNRGEVTRLWIFLACFFQIPAAWALAAIDRRWAFAAAAATTAAQTALGVALIHFAVP